MTKKNDSKIKCQPLISGKLLINHTLANKMNL